jgi:hypothetical protein
MSTLTFAEAYCLHHKIPADRFATVVLARSLYPHARLLAPLLREMNSDHFAADLDLVRGAGLLRRVRDFSNEAAEFAYHPANRGDLRRLLRLRISTQRLRHLMQETLHGTTNQISALAGTAELFPAKSEAGLSPDAADQSHQHGFT